MVSGVYLIFILWFSIIGGIVGYKDDLYGAVVDALVKNSDVNDVMLDRVYFLPEVRDYLEVNNLKYASSSLLSLDLVRDLERVGWLDKEFKSRFILSGRVVVPIRNASGEIVTLVGWRKGASKYLTVQDSSFSKEAHWFNIDRAISKSFSSDSLMPRSCIVVEGIFDALMLDAIGLPAVATMGATVNHFKGGTLGIFDKIVCMPDNDKVGRRAFMEKEWKVPSSATFLYIEPRRLVLGDDISVSVKDADNLVNYSGDTSGVISLFQEVSQQYGGVVYV